MAHLLEILGRGLLGGLESAYSELHHAYAQVTHDADPSPEGPAETDADLCGSGHPHSDPDYSGIENSKNGEQSPALEKALQALRDRKFGMARDCFETAIEEDPGNRLAHVGLACTLDELGLTRLSIEQLVMTVETFPTDAASWFALGFCHEKVGDIEDAIDAYHTAVDIAPQLRNAHERLAAIFLKLDELDAAIAHYEHICFCEPEDINASLTLASLLVKAEQFEEAIRRYQFALTIDPENWEIQDDLLSAYIEQGRLDDARERIGKLLERSGENPDLHVRMGDVQRMSGNEPGACESYARAVDLHPEHLEATIKLGTMHLRRGEHLEAARAFGRAVELNDRLLSAYLGLGVAQEAAGRQAEAEESFELAAGVEPNSTLLFSETARLQLMVAADEQRRRYIDPKQVAAHPGSPADGPVEDLIDLQIGRLHDALDAHPDYADLHYRLGLLLRSKGDLDGAVTAYRHAVEINPNYAKALTKLGLCLTEMGELDEAVEMFQDALDIDDETADLHYQLGLVFADRNEFNRALEQFEQAIKLEPDRAHDVAHIALALENMNLTDRANAGWRCLCEAGTLTQSEATSHSADSVPRPTDLRSR